MAIAVLVALAMPVSQIRTVSIVARCCCPDPAKCHCPDHSTDSDGPPTLRPCYRSEHVVVAAAPLATAPSAIECPDLTAQASPVLFDEPKAPHAAPPPARPAAPS